MRGRFVFRDQQTYVLPVFSVTSLPRSGGTVLTIPDGLTVENTRWSEILIEKRLFPYTMHLHSMVQYSAEILPQGWYEDMVTRFNTIHERDRQQTARQTDGHIAAA